MRLITAAVLACTLIPPMAIAQTHPTTTPPATTAAPTPANGQWRASKLIGVNIYNEQNDKIGDINDLIIDASGKVDGVVIAVGGFLGAGEHDVMMPMNKIKFSNKAGTTTTGSASSGLKQWYPDRGTVDATKDQLKAMPQFKY